MLRRKLAFALAQLPLVALALGCAGEEPAEGGQSSGAENLDVGGQVEIFSWWTSGGERDALDALLEVHEARVPDASVRNSALEHRDRAREMLVRRLAQGTPPELFQAIAGEDLMGWVRKNGIDDDDSCVESLTDLADGAGLTGVFAPEVLDAATLDGELYGLPVNVHRLNTLYYDRARFEAFDLSPPTSLEELRELCEALEDRQDLHDASPTGVMSCIGFGAQHAWTLSELTFEMVLPAVAGGEFYERYFRGREDPEAPEVRAAIEYALDLYCGGRREAGCSGHGWFNPDVDQLTWDEGVMKLANGTVLMAVMGDWATGLLASPSGGGLEPGVDFGVVPFPGTTGTFVFSSDAFALPRGARNRDGARSLLATMASPEGQRAFNQKKGSIPARTDLDPRDFDPVIAETMREFQDGLRVRSLSALLPAELEPLLASELKASFQKGSPEIILNFLRANYRSFGAR